MNKKEYKKPQFEVIRIKCNYCLLQASGTLNIMDETETSLEQW